MDSIILENKYINIIYEIFNSYLYGKEIEVVHKEEAKLLGIIPYIKTVKEMRNISVENSTKDLKSFKERELTSTLDIVNFKSLWQFCQFVRFAEKSFCYINTPEKHLFVDSEMNDLSKRNFRISTDDRLEIFCTLEKVNEPVNRKHIDVIRIKIQRNFGKQMLNEFTIVDDFVKSKDSSDSILIENIFYIIAEEIKNSFNHILSKVVYIGQERNKNEKERKYYVE